MRTYGRVRDSDGNAVWAEVNSDEVGDDYVWVTTLVQCLLLNLGESPFFAQHGIPAQRSVIQQVFPDFYVSRTQSQFAPYFASLIVAKLEEPNPHYRVNVVTNQGVPLAASIPY